MAETRTREFLSARYPRNLGPEIDAEIRRRVAMVLDQADMQARCRRW